MFDIILTFLATFGVTMLHGHVKSAAARATVTKIAKAILASSDNNTTDPAVAVREATVAANSEVIAKQVAEMERQRDAGELRVATTIAKAKEDAKGYDVTIVPRDGSEVYGPGWPLK